MASLEFRQGSKADWVTTDTELTLEQIQCGATLRIADACELMAQNHARLVEERDRYARRYESERQTAARLNKSNAALRGVIGRMKRQNSKRV